MPFKNGEIAQIEKLARNSVSKDLCTDKERRIKELEDDQKHNESDIRGILIAIQEMKIQMISLTTWNKGTITVTGIAAVIVIVLKTAGKI